MTWQEALKGYLGTLTWPDDSQKAKGLASVLVPLGWNPEAQRDEILLTKRTTLVESHKGQVSFPGGFREVDDVDLLHTALREAEEEVGIRTVDVEILGRLTPVLTHQEVLIYPWVGWMRFPYSFRVNQVEVEKILYLSVEQLLKDGLSQVKAPVGQLLVASQGVFAEGELVWGATARILGELRERLLPFHPSVSSEG